MISLLAVNLTCSFFTTGLVTLVMMTVQTNGGSLIVKKILELVPLTMYSTNILVNTMNSKLLALCLVVCALRYGSVAPVAHAQISAREKPINYEILTNNIAKTHIRLGKLKLADYKNEELIRRFRSVAKHCKKDFDKRLCAFSIKHYSDYAEMLINFRRLSIKKPMQYKEIMQEWE